MHLFYEPDFLTNGNILNPEESKHCVRVLRHNVGNKVSVMNGKGSIFITEIIEANPKKCALQIISETKEQPRPFSLHMAVAPTKNIDRFEWFLEKATEIGIEEITPIICDHSERKVIKPERLEKVITAATKQSLRAYRPKLNPAVSFEQFLTTNYIGYSKYIAHCYDNPKQLLKSDYSENENALILIGPEGDFSEKEVEAAHTNNYRAISLGKARLRTETAAIMSCTIINITNQKD
jgi:16S rRNA (uracil1498-N3)-methyltransferase